MIYTLEWGNSPLLISIPHCGTNIPMEHKNWFTKRALKSEDTDWFLDEIYSFAHKKASILTSKISRYVIDNNRPPKNEAMYAGQNNTELCPTRHFTGEAIYETPIDEAEVAYRRMKYWRQYHNTLNSELERLKAKYGYALLWDAHSIKSELPWLFEGKLPELNLGTNNGASCSPLLLGKLETIAAQSGFSYAVNGRFKGGYITRNYGKPQDNIHAVQLEMTYSTYMEEQEPYTLDEARLKKLTPVLKHFIETMVAWKP